MTELEVGKARINFHADEKIAFGKEFAYSNVTFGLSITRDVPDEGTAADLRPHVDELVAEVEDFLSVEREKILEIIQGQASSATKR
jgi:hypothetical protein